MLAIERRNAILGKLQTDRKVIVSELSSIYNVSEETIRRDLDRMEKEGIVTKSYGGAVLNEDAGLELPFNVRKNHNVREKLRIAKILAERVKDGESIMLDASSTAVFIARQLKGKKDLTVITNAIEILIELSDMKDWHVMGTGGILQGGALAMVGPHTDQMIKNFHVDKAIISCKGLDIEGGITDSSEMHAVTKATMLKAADEKILAADSSKFDRIAFTRIGYLSDIQTLITDREPHGKWVNALHAAGVDCIWEEKEQ